MLLTFPRRLKYIVLFIYTSIAIIALIFSFFGVKWLTIAAQFFIVKDIMINDGTMALAIGVTMLLSVVLGIYAVINENTCLLAVYGGILMATFVVLLTYGAYSFLNILNADEALLIRIKDNIKKILDEDFYEENLNKDLIRLQMEFRCCGSTGPDDYPPTKIPSSCCQDEQNPCVKPFKIGCAEAMTEDLKNTFRWNGLFAIMIAALSLIGASLILTVSRSRLIALSSGISV